MQGQKKKKKEETKNTKKGGKAAAAESKDVKKREKKAFDLPGQKRDPPQEVSCVIALPRKVFFFFGIISGLN